MTGSVRTGVKRANKAGVESTENREGGARPGLRACILGASLDVGNRGVRALGASLAELIRSSSSTAGISFHYGSPTGGTRDIGGSSGETLHVGVFNCRMSPKSRVSEHIVVILVLALLYRLGLREPAKNNAWLRSLLAADFIGDIRGGDSFSDIYGLRRFVIGSLPLLTVAVLGRPYAMLPQTYGPFRSAVARRLAGALLARASAIVTRDRNSARNVLQLCGRAPQFCPDVAFILAPSKPGRLHIEPSGVTLDAGEDVIGLNVSGLLHMGGYTGRNMFGLRGSYPDLVRQLVERIVRTTSAKILLIPHTFGSEGEEAACHDVLEFAATRHPGRVCAVVQPLDERQIKWVIGRTKFFIGSRMHACIAALSQCIPAVGLAYSDKFLGVFQSAGVGETILDLRRLEPTDVVEQTLAAMGRHAQLRERLVYRVPEIQAEVRQAFRELLARTPS